MGFNFTKAKREKARLRICLMGASGGGKTLSSLYLASGLTNGDWSKICVVDSENGRALMYANRTDLNTGEFLHGNIEAPYSVERYCEAMEEASKIVGSDGVIIVDSASHAWKGEGGVLDAKERISQQRGKTDFSAWADAGKLQNKFIDTMMGLDCHVILTLRSKTAYAQEVDPETGKTRVRKVGLEPEQRGDFEYEATIVFDIDKDTHNATICKDNTFLDAEGFYGRLTPKIGERLREWVDSGAEPIIHTCAKCGKKIKPYSFDGETVMNVDELIANSKETFNMELCGDCVLELSSETEETAEDNVEETEEKGE